MQNTWQTNIGVRFFYNLKSTMLGIDGGHVGDQTKPILYEVISFPLKTLSLFFNKAAWLLPRV